MIMTRPLFVCVVLALALGVQSKSCLAPFTMMGNKCYYVSLAKANWHVADRHCRKIGGDLAVFDNEQDKAQVTSSLIGLGLPFADGWHDSVWVGINCLGDRHNFRLSRTGDTVTYLPWVRDQPDNISPEEDCVAFANYNQAFGYHDIECHIQFPFLCEVQADDYLCLKKDLFVKSSLYN